MQNKPVEIILFYINDENKNIENVLGIFKTVNENITPEEMLKMCIWSIKKTMPRATITLFTDEKTNIHDPSENISVVRFGNISHDKLMFDLQKIRKEYISNQIKKGIEKNYIMTDIDVLFNKSMEHIFDLEFDIASPATFHNLEYSPRGVPYNSLMSIINGGLWFIKPSPTVIDFYESWLTEMLSLERNDDLAEYGSLAPMVKKDFLKWWGEPHSLMVMFGKYFSAGERELINYNGTLFRLIDESLYNYAPDVKIDGNRHSLDLNRENINSRYLIHLRGGRKLFMRNVAAYLGYK